MRHSIFLAIAVLFSSGAPASSADDDESPNIPQEWRVELKVRVSAFEGRSRKVPSKTIELTSTGEITEKTAPFNSEPEKTTKKTLSPQDTLTGLHIAWTALEDAPLLGGNVEDTDYAHLLLETNDWTWKRSWFVYGSSTKAVEQGRESLFKLIQGGKIDPVLFRTRHRTAAELRERWMQESKTRNRYISWEGIAAEGDESFTFASRPPGPSKVELAKDYGPLISLLADLRGRCLDREERGNKKVEFSFLSGGGTHNTSIQIKALKDFSEAGPRIEQLILQAKDAKSKSK